MEQYIKLFAPIAESGVNVHVYTSPELAHYFTDYPKNIRVFAIPLTYFEMWNLGIKSDAALPNELNPEKDTREYLALMNTKVEFLMRSLEICEDSNLIWIDFAILKLFKNPERCIEYFKEYTNMLFDKVNIPGCWYKGEALYLNAIHWRFCGSFFVVPRIHMERFYKDCKDSFTGFLTHDGHILTWEVNVWNHVEFYKGQDYKKWYYALHDDGILKSLIENIDPWTGQKI